MSKLACITLDMEPDYGDPQKKIRLLETPEYYERYISIINKYGVKVTMFTVTSLFEKRGEQFKELASRIPLEFSVHSHTHDPRRACTEDEVSNAKNAYQEFTGKAPLGYRAPIGNITKDGLGHLMNYGYSYDASVYPSIRPGEFGYFNLHMPNVPFRVTREDGESLVEFPFTAIEKARIVFAMSYAKLFGWMGYSTLLNIFGLPDTALFLSHPYDFYFGFIPNNTVTGLERLALARNSKRAFDYFEKVIRHLKNKGYKFVFISELHNTIEDSDIETYPWEDWK